MARHLVKLGTLTIANGQTISNVIDSKIGFGHLIDMIIYTAATLTGTVTVEVAPIEGAVAGDFRPLHHEGADFTLPADKGVTIPAVSFYGIRLVSGAAEASARVFDMVGQVDMAT